MKLTKKIKLTPEQRAAELAACEMVTAKQNEFAGCFSDASTEEFYSDPTSIRLRSGDIIRYGGTPHIVTRSGEAGAKIMPMTRKVEKWVTKLTGKPVEFTKRATGHNISRHLDKTWLISRGGAQALEDFLNGKHQPVTDEQQQKPDARKQNTKTMKALNEDTAIAAPGPYDSKPAPAVKKVKPAKTTTPKAEKKPKTPAKDAKKAAAKPAKKTDGAPVVRSEQKEYIWSQLDGSKTKKEICAAVVKKFGTDAETAAKRINDAPFYMRKAGLKPAWKE